MALLPGPSLPTVFKPHADAKDALEYLGQNPPKQGQGSEAWCKGELTTSSTPTNPGLLLCKAPG